jgi:hypothetical protein
MCGGYLPCAKLKEVTCHVDTAFAWFAVASWPSGCTLCHSRRLRSTSHATNTRKAEQQVIIMDDVVAGPVSLSSFLGSKASQWGQKILTPNPISLFLSSFHKWVFNPSICHALFLGMLLLRFYSSIMSSSVFSFAFMSQLARTRTYCADHNLYKLEYIYKTIEEPESNSENKAL